MSDEFNVEGRTFTDGDDPMWTALDKPDDDFGGGGRGSLHFYNSSRVSTEGGYLKINTRYEKTKWNYLNVTSRKYTPMERTIASGMLQGWNKFCFTGGIVEVDVIFPGIPNIGGLWPAVWMLGNLGRASYEASTNNLWPWSFDSCDKKLQEAQTISACNNVNHYGLEPHVGRGSTEIDIVEVMYGPPGKLPNTFPPVEQPYADFTLQVAPGVSSNRPPFGLQPVRHYKDSHGKVHDIVNTWYEGLGMQGNTSLNPFFYGTYLGETMPGEPVQRSKHQSFQADAICAMNQLVDDHFNNTHTFRIEWQPGNGGRLDWYVQGYRIVNETTGEVSFMTGDGQGKDWYPAYTIHDDSLKNVQGAQIPIEPSYLILNTAVSATWGFPYAIPDWCTSHCYDCADPKCHCNFYDGFCDMVGAPSDTATPASKSKNPNYNPDGVTFLIDSVRVYQSFDHDAHVGQPHTLGCDPPEYPTRQFIKANQGRYKRSPPWGYEDWFGSMRTTIQKGGASCSVDSDCGGLNTTDATHNSTKGVPETNSTNPNRGYCGAGWLFVDHVRRRVSNSVCVCNSGFTGPNCLAMDHKDTFPSAYKVAQGKNMFLQMEHFHIPLLVIVLLVGMAMLTAANMHHQVKTKQRDIELYKQTLSLILTDDSARHLAKPRNVTETTALLSKNSITSKQKPNDKPATAASEDSVVSGRSI